MSDTELIALLEKVGAVKGLHYQYVEVKDRPEPTLMLSKEGVKLLASSAPDQDAARRLVAWIDEEFPSY
jgi:hypothetical protein